MRFCAPAFVVVLLSSADEHRRALHLAVQSADVRRARELLDMGANASELGSGSSSTLHTAALLGSLEMVKLMLQHRVGVNAQDAQGWTPLHIAAGRGHVLITELLLAHGGDACVATLDGRIARDLAHAVSVSAPEPLFGQPRPLQLIASERLLEAERRDANRRYEAGGQRGAFAGASPSDGVDSVCRYAKSCSAFACPAGYVANPVNANLTCSTLFCTVSDVPRCCLERCDVATFTCPSGYVKKSNASAILCFGGRCSTAETDSAATFIRAANLTEACLETRAGLQNCAANLSSELMQEASRASPLLDFGGLLDHQVRRVSQLYVLLLRNGWVDNIGFQGLRMDQIELLLSDLQKEVANLAHKDLSTCCMSR